jgi:hypothetical protein
MSNVFVNDESLAAVANVIRSKNGTDNTYKPTEMAGAVAKLPSYVFVKNLIEKSSTATEIVIPDYVTAIGRGAFSYSPHLTSITIPDSVTNIDDYAFNGCTSLKKITIPDSVTNIDDYAFNGCTSLKKITIPDSVTSIGGYAFNGCTSLTSITIPDSVTNIGGYAFLNCKSLEFVKLGQGFNANNLDLSASTKYTRETIVSWLNALKDRSDIINEATYKFTIGSENLAKLTAEDIKIATDKNWTLS